MAETCEKWCGVCLATTAHTMVKNLWVCDKCADKKTEPKNTQIKPEETNMANRAEKNKMWAEIARRADAGEKVKDLSKEFKLSKCTIYAKLKKGGVKVCKVGEPAKAASTHNNLDQAVKAALRRILVSMIEEALK